MKKNTPTIEAFSLGFVGPVWRFNQDNTLVIYVPCGIDLSLKLKDKVASGTWEIENNDYLHIHINEKGDWDRDTDQTLKIEAVTDADGFETLQVEQRKFGRFNSKTVNCGEPLQ